MTTSPNDRLARATLSLDGLSVGDAFAAAHAYRLHQNSLPSGADFLALVLFQVPDGEVASGIRQAQLLLPGTTA